MSWKGKTHYELLQVSPFADEGIIRAAYRVTISRYHPDRYSPKNEAEEISKALNLALHVLTDPERRKAYDESINRKRESDTSSNADQKESANHSDDSVS